MKITKLEDLIVWQESVKLTKIIYDLVKLLPLDERFNFIKHMKACSRNIPANIAEGFGRFHYQEQARFNRIARGSLLELKSDILCCINLNLLNTNQTEKALAQIDLVHKLLNSFIKSTLNLKNK